MHWQDDDPGLPIKFGPCSNGEYPPAPLSPVVRETIRRARLECDDAARRTGMSRRRFLLSICGAATTLLALEACADEESRRAGPGRGGRYDIPPDATTDPDAARQAIGGDEFIFDLQGHFLDYDLNPATRGKPNFGSGFPQANCGEADPRACFTMQHFLDEMFVKSDTSMVMLSSLPLLPEGSPLSAKVMDEARRVAAALCHDERVLLHAQALPNIGPLGASLDAMEDAVDRYPVKAWKVYTLFTGPEGRGWFLDDRERGAAVVGTAFVDKAVALGVPIICAHKGFSGGSKFGSPVDVGPAAKRHPAARFVVYHSGYEAGTAEGPYTEAAANVGINRLITSLRQSGIGPNQNVYAELGSTWWNVMRSPTEAAHVLGKLLRHVGEDNVVWGTDSIWYGSPQDQIQAFRAFEITSEFQERYGYPALTKDIKAKVLGRNAARLHGVEPATRRCPPFTRDDLERLRRTLPGRNQAYGPTTRRELLALTTHLQGWP